MSKETHGKTVDNSSSEPEQWRWHGIMSNESKQDILVIFHQKQQKSKYWTELPCYIASTILVRPSQRHGLIRSFIHIAIHFLADRFLARKSISESQ
jgi:hypothetical protein